MDQSDALIYADKNIPFEAVQEKLAAYQSDARNERQAPFNMSGLAPLEEAQEFSPKGHGVYILYRANCSLIYIGISLSNIAGRIAKHLSAAERRYSFWSVREPSLAQTVFTPFDWETPSLEAYLVDWAEAFPIPTVARSHP